MSPDIIWSEIKQYIAFKDERIDYMTLCNDLERLLKSDSFPPHITGNEKVDRVIALSVCDWLTTAGNKV